MYGSPLEHTNCYTWGSTHPNPFEPLYYRGNTDHKVISYELRVVQPIIHDPVSGLSTYVNSNQPPVSNGRGGDPQFSRSRSHQILTRWVLWPVQEKVSTRYRHGRVGCLDDTVRVVESSAEVNTAQLVGAQDGTVVVPTMRQGLVSSSVTVFHYIIP